MQIDLETSSLIALLLVSTRILAWAVVSPPIATGMVPHPVKVILSVGICLAIVPAVRAQAPVAEVAPMAGALLAQVVIGAGLGFLTRLASSVSGLFVSALQIAGPLIVVLFIADMALGVRNRIAPQLNAFALSFRSRAWFRSQSAWCCRCCAEPRWPASSWPSPTTPSSASANNKQLKMTKQEVKDEYKSSEGDPHQKGAIRSRQMAMRRNRMMADVPNADVIVVNPTHVAVALKYDPAKGAPRVVAKGGDHVAARIRALAEEHRIPLVSDIPLARTLFKTCDIGQEIPPDLYKAVATVLAFIMTLRKRGSTAGTHTVRTLAATGR